MPIRSTFWIPSKTASAPYKVVVTKSAVEEIPLNARSQPAPDIIDRDEYQYLVAHYGQPALRAYRLQADDYLFTSRKYRSQNRRGEVVLVIERPVHSLLVHRKSWYEAGVFRLLSGGIDPEERIEDALWRELEEETGLTSGEAEFIGILDCRMFHGSEEVVFPSFVFYLTEFDEAPILLDSSEDISQFQDLPIQELPRLAETLRSVPGERNGWGHWRAIAHDFVFGVLTT